MSLVSLTVDLTLGLATLQGDAGKATQIFVRSTDEMDRASKRLAKTIERQFEGLGRGGVEYQVLKIAAAGLGDAHIAMAQKVAASGSSFLAVGAQGAAAFKGIAVAADQAAEQSGARIATIVAKAREVSAQADTLRTTARTERAGGVIDDDGLKKRLADIKAVEQATLQSIKVEIDGELEVQRAAQVEKAAADVRIAAAQKIIDAQNGITASYRAQLAQLTELRDKGALSPAQFKQARTELVAAQPVNVSAASALSSAQTGASAATAAAQSQVYAAFLLAQAAATERVAQAEAHEAEVSKAVASASDRARSAQQAQYETKTAFIARVNEEAAALFRTKDAQAALDAQRAGVGAQQAAQLAKFSGDKSFIATIYEQIEAEKKKGSEFGKTAAEILKQEAALRGLTNTTSSAISRYEALAKANKDVADQAQRRKSAESFLASVNTVAAGINTDGTQKARSDILALQAAELGVGREAEAALAKIALLDAKTGQLGKGAFATRNQLLTLKYTLSDVVASAASGISPLTILLQQGGQVAQIEGGIGGLFKTVLSLITPVRLAIGATAATVGALAYAFYEGSSQSKAFQDSLLLTGGYVGKTEGQFNALARSVASSGKVTVGAAREYAQALVSTGEVGPRVFSAAAEAAALYGKASGKNAEDVAKDFASMSADAAKWAADHNKSLNFLTAAQYDQIKSLQEQGRAAEAQGIVYDALTQRFKKVDENLGYLGKTLQVGKNLWSGFWDAAFDIGRTETLDDKLQRAASAVDALRARQAVGRSANPAFSSAPALRPEDTAGEDKRTANLLATQTAAEIGIARQVLRQQDNAFAEADRADTAKAAIAFKDKLDAILIKAKTNGEYDKKVAEFKEGFRVRAEAGRPVSDADQKAALAQLKKDFTDKGSVNDADAERKAQLDQSLKFLQDNLARQKDTLKFNQDVVAAQYAASNISLKAYYDERERITAEGVQKELNELTDAQAAIEVDLEKGGFKNAAERTKLERQLQETIAKSANIERDAGNAAKLATLERAAAFKQLTDRVAEYRAQLLQSEGDEEGAARIRAQQAIRAAQLFAKQSGGLVSEDDLARQQRAIDTANALAEVQRRVGIVSAAAANAEELFLLRASQAGVSLRDTEAGVYTIRAQAVEQLRIAAEKTQALADANAAASAQAGTVANPALLLEAAKAALAYAKALESVDPALVRLREKTDALAQSTAESAVSSLLNYGDAYRARAAKAQQEVSSQAKAYDDQLVQLRGYLAASNDAKERARLQDLIKQAEARRKSLNVDKGDTTLKTIERDVLGPILKQIRDAAVKQFVTEPLQKYLKDSLSSLTQGDGFLAKLFGSKTTDGQAAQTDAVTASTNALTTFNSALAQASTTLEGGFRFGQPTSDPIALRAAVEPGADQSGEDYSHEFMRAQTQSTEAAQRLASGLDETKYNADQLAAALPIAGALFQRLGGSAGQAGQALQLLPRVIALIEAAASGSSGGGFGSLASLFSGGGSSSGGGSGYYVSGNFDASTVGMSLAVGTNRVPYDGFRATLHKDEAVVPAAYNPAVGGSMVTPIRGNGSGSWSGGDTYISIEDHAGGKVSTQESKSGDDKYVKVIVEQAVRQSVAEVNRQIVRGGSTHEALKSTGLNLDGGNARRD